MDGSRITLELAGAAIGFGQPIADLWLTSDLPVAAGARPEAPPAGKPVPPGGPWRLVFRGPATVEGTLQEVAVSRDARGDRRVEFADGERFWIAAGGARVVRLPPPPAPLAGERLVERAVGAPLALALGAHGVHLLHASALADREGRVAAITAGSGGGKSTLAAAAASHPELGLRRVADDVLPVRLGGAPAALPRFPQLKLPAGQQYPAAGASSLPLAVLVEIEHAAGLPAIECARAPEAEALLGLVRATVAARLFDAGPSAAHFEACADACRVLPVVRLRFPSGPAGARAALAAIAGLLRAEEPGPGSRSTGWGVPAAAAERRNLLE